ncbi:MAG: hypothetical protein ACFE95_00080 [Candidatus Hodarchaeota archaeon]
MKEELRKEIIHNYDNVAKEYGEYAKHVIVSRNKPIVNIYGSTPETQKKEFLMCVCARVHSQIMKYNKKNIRVIGCIVDLTVA